MRLCFGTATRSRTRAVSPRGDGSASSEAIGAHSLARTPSTCRQIPRAAQPRIPLTNEQSATPRDLSNSYLPRFIGAEIGITSFTRQRTIVWADGQRLLFYNDGATYKFVNEMAWTSVSRPHFQTTSVELLEEGLSERVRTRNIPITRSQSGKGVANTAGCG